MLKKIINCITTVIVIIAVVLAVLLVGIRVFGFTPFAILSPSMSPKYPTGDLVYVQKKDFEEIKVGDVITFVGGEDLVTVTHRVDEIDSENRSFYTKGDANNSRDGAPVIYENVIGVVAFSIPKLGYAAFWLSQKTGRYCAVAILALCVLLAFLPDVIKYWKKQDTKQ